MLNHSFRFFKNNNLYSQKFNSPAHLSQGLCFSLHPKCISLLYLSVTLNPTLACLSKDRTLLPYCKIMSLLKNKTKQNKTLVWRFLLTPNALRAFLPPPFPSPPIPLPFPGEDVLLHLTCF